MSHYITIPEKNTSPEPPNKQVWQRIETSIFIQITMMYPSRFSRYRIWDAIAPYTLIRAPWDDPLGPDFDVFDRPPPWVTDNVPLVFNLHPGVRIHGTPDSAPEYVAKTAVLSICAERGRIYTRFALDDDFEVTKRDIDWAQVMRDVAMFKFIERVE